MPTYQLSPSPRNRGLGNYPLRTVGTHCIWRARCYFLTDYTTTPYIATRTSIDHCQSSHAVPTLRRIGHIETKLTGLQLGPSVGVEWDGEQQHVDHRHYGRPPPQCPLSELVVFASIWFSPLCSLGLGTETETNIPREMRVQFHDRAGNAP